MPLAPHPWQSANLHPRDKITCHRCPLPKANAVHSEEQIAKRQAELDKKAARVADAQEAHRRRTGESQ